MLRHLSLYSISPMFHIKMAKAGYSMSKGTIEQISDILDWIEQNYKTNNVINLSQANTKLGLLSVTLGEKVTDAYDVQQTLETDYDNQFAKRSGELVEGGMSSAASKTKAEAELVSLKKDCSVAKVIHKKLNSHLERLDKVMDAVKQQISVVNKTDLKRL
jgi:hypothetical protein